MNPPEPETTEEARPGEAGSRAPRRRRRVRLNRQEIIALIERFEASGLPAVRFAQQAGVCRSSLQRWRRRLAAAAGPGAPAAAGFARVQLGEVVGGRESIVVRLEGAGVSVSVPAGTDALWLGRLLGCLREGSGT